MYKIDQLTEIDLGVVQENEATEIQIDVSPWLKKWPDGIFAVNVCRPGEMEPYPANCRVEDGMLYWLVTEGELAIAGNGRCDIRLYQGTVKKKTRIAITRIHETLPGSTQEAPPDEAQGWMDSLNETRAEVESNTQAAKESAEKAALSEVQAMALAQSAAESANAAETAKQHAEQAAESAQQHAESAAQDAQFLSQRSAVWIGEEAPPEPGYDLWVNPEGRETELPGGGTYELPTASADTKGGVKVGPGLQMDGDVLGVKPGSPFIKYKEITLEQETVVIEEDIPECNECIVTGSVIKGSTNDSGYVLISKNGESVGALGSGGVISSNVDVVFRAHAYQAGSIWVPIFYKANRGEGAQTYGPVNPQYLSQIKSIPTVNHVKIYCFKTGFPAGSTFAIYIQEV